MTGMTAGREGRDKGFSHDPETHLNRNRMDLYLAIVVIMLVLAVAGLVVGVSNDAGEFSQFGLRLQGGCPLCDHDRRVGRHHRRGHYLQRYDGGRAQRRVPSADVHVRRGDAAVSGGDVHERDSCSTCSIRWACRRRQTVSLVFGLLGAAVGICVFKLSNGSVVTMPDGDPASMADMINTGNAMAIIGGILISVAIAFVCGTVVMYVTRLIFSFRYQKKLRTVGALWCGIALTAISYFAVFKGLKGTSVIPAHAMAWMEHHTLAMLAAMVSRLESADVVAEPSENQYTAIDRVGRDLFARACLRG